MVSRVAVIGAGITGLAAAWELHRSSAGAIEPTLFEAQERVGGKLRTSEFAGRRVDEGADAFLARVPTAVGLAAEVGLDDLVSPATGHAAIVLDRLVELPDGLAMGVPTAVAPILRRGILSWRGVARAGVDLVRPRSRPHDSLGRLVRTRLGDEVHDRLVDALVGSIYGADTDRYSLAMVPQLAAMARSRSLILGARRARRAAPPSDPATPLFLAPAAGMEAMASAVDAQLAAAGVERRLAQPVGAVAPDGRRWRVDGEPFDAVLIAAPARQAAGMLRDDVPDAAALLGAIETAGVAIVTMAVPALPTALGGLSGYLVPKSRQRTVTATSFGSQKWARWAGPDEILRVSAGRDGLPIPDDDDELAGRCVDEVGAHIGADLAPTSLRVTRWPDAFPQYRPNHRRWLATLDRATPSGLGLAGASYRGIGVPACVADGRQAARRIAGELAPR